jgi:hypothetical protein
MRRLFDFLRADDIPKLCRASYIAELRYYLLWSFVVGAIEGNIAGLIAKKTFHAPDWVTSIIWALPISANLLNLMWGVLLRGRQPVACVRNLTLVVCPLVASISIASPAWGALGIFAFALQVGLVHSFTSGLLSLRVAIWRANYPAAERGRITGRLQAVRMLIILICSASLAWLFDNDPGLYRWLYPAIAGLGLLSLIPLRGLRVRGQARERSAIAAQQAGETGLSAGLRESMRILRDDRAFARYMVAQFVMGSANYFTDAILLTVLAGKMGLGYLATSVFMIQVPTIVMLFAIRFWAPYFDRVGVVRFRVLNSGLWVVSYALVAAAMLCVENASLARVTLGLLLIGRIANGICRGGGTLAWSIGHLHFARPNQSELYMGIHVGLTGVRGLVMPPLGALANQLMGPVSFLLSLALSVTALILFRRIERIDRRATSG